MQLTKACCNILDQLEALVQQITDADFIKPSTALSKSSIGQHLRHTIEFFICFENGAKVGLINYDKRAHDKLIESDRFIAINAIRNIREFVSRTPSQDKLRLEVGYDRLTDECVTIETNFARELVYNIEHAVHHMAIMKIGVREVAPYVKLAPDFGIAVSTLRYSDAVTHTH